LQERRCDFVFSPITPNKFWWCKKKKGRFSSGKDVREMGTTVTPSQKDEEWGSGRTYPDMKEYREAIPLL
jgi:hypothetical protein